MVITAALIVISILFFMAWLSSSGHASGLTTNSLAPCPDKPNCVCSEDAHDTQHYVAPLSITGDQIAIAMHAIETSIKSLGGKIQTQDTHYIAATFSSSFFGFIDDVEFRIDAEQQHIHIRSAARMGHSDFGVNKKRAQHLTTILRQQLDQTASSSSN